LVSVFEGAAIGIGICTLDGHFRKANEGLAAMLGYSCHELVGRCIRDLRSGTSDGKDFLPGETQRGAHSTLRQESRLLRKDGSDLWCEMTISVVHDDTGEPASLLLLMEDTTGRKHAAEKSLEAEKMEVIGRLAGGIAHDFNNLLTGVLLYCDLLSDGLKRGSRLRQHVEEIRLAGEQGAALTQQLLAMARKQVLQLQPIVLNEIVSSTKGLLRRLIGEQVKLVTRLSPKLPPVMADPVQLRQVLLNLVLNARDAMPQGGQIIVRTHPRGPLQGAHSKVALLVEDNGRGMDEATRARLFEPFFTTKESGRGTGLGLATVKRIVTESGGLIEVKSEPGRGTQIQVLFPVIDGVSTRSVAKRSSVAGRTVLLVDDHSSARNSIQRVLQRAGYRVLAASSGESALQIFSEHSQEVSLLLADWMMPCMTGRELAERLVQQKPELKVLLISGYHDLRDGAPDDSMELIRKPFAGNVLLERVREVLDAKGDSPW
jgi:PAS domain S-box-containing protein